MKVRGVTSRGVTYHTKVGKGANKWKGKKGRRKGKRQKRKGEENEEKKRKRRKIIYENRGVHSHRVPGLQEIMWAKILRNCEKKKAGENYQNDPI